MSVVKRRFLYFIEKYRGMTTPAKAGLWFTISAFMQRGIAFLTTPIFTRILTTEQYGIVSVYNTWEQLIVVLCTLNLFYGGFNNGMRDYKDGRDEYVSAIQGLITAITIVWIVVYFIGRHFWEDLLDMKPHIVMLMFLQIVTGAALSLWAARERFEFKYKSLVIVTVTNTFLGAVIPIIAILLVAPEYGAEARIISHALSIACVCGCIYFYNLIKGKVFFSKEIWNVAFLFNLPLLPHYLSTMILNHSDRIMISKMVGSSEAGIYSVAYSAAMILNILSTSINHSFAPWIYVEIDRKEYKRIARVGNAMFVGLALVLMALIAFAPEAIYVFAGSKYTDAVRIVPSVAASLYFIFMYQIFANVEFYYKRNKFIAYASMSGAVLNLILNYFGIKLFGYIAPGYTTLICYIVFGGSHYLFMRRICKEELDGIKLFDAMTIFSIAVGLIIFSIMMVFLYSFTIVRYIILTIIVVVATINKNKIVSYMKMFKKKER
ncbi:MAG: hypothetical protein E7232_08725 [Lachnospiraceae bacterium]|nr:hypothetical protein [Lachnospiraceae bacterium]